MTHWDDAVLSTAAVIVALTVVIGALWKLYALVKNIEAAIGKDEEGHTLAENVRVIRGVLFPPGEISLPKRVDLIETEIAVTQRAVERLGNKLDVIEVAVIRKADKDVD